jgi:chromosome partitioning protein
MPRTHVVAVANQKGGVAKTTSVASLGAAFAELGRRVLLVDLDAQASLTFSLGLDPDAVEVSVYEVLLGKASATDAIAATDDGVDLLPSTIELAGAEAQLLSRPGREFVLRSALEGVVDDYDVVLLDCAPSLGVLTLNALTAADEVLIPLQCEMLSHRGVGQLLDTIADVQKILNRELSVLGVLPTMYDARTTHSRAVLADVGERYDLPVLSPIPKSVRFAEAPPWAARSWRRLAGRRVRRPTGRWPRRCCARGASGRASGSAAEGRQKGPGAPVSSDQICAPPSNASTKSANAIAIRRGEGERTALTMVPARRPAAAQIGTRTTVYTNSGSVFSYRGLP